MLIKEREKLTQGVRTVLTMVDRGSFVELGSRVAEQETDIYFPKSVESSDGVVTGYATIENRPVYIFCQDRDTMGGTFGVAHAHKIYQIYKMAQKAKAPVIGIIDSAGLRIEEAADGLNAFARLCREVIRAKEDIIEIMITDKNCKGSMATLAHMGDFVFDSEDETVTDKIRQLIKILPPAKNMASGWEETGDDLNRICSNIEAAAGDTAALLGEISDDGLVLEINSKEGRDMTTAFIKLGGKTVGVLANHAGDEGDKRMTEQGIKKAAAFAELCGKLNTAILTVVNNTGLADYHDTRPDEAAGVLAAAMVQAAVPKICLITGEARGLGYIIMSSKGLGADMIFAWPAAKVTMISSRQAAELLWPDTAPADIEAKAAQYEEARCGVSTLLERGYADKVISPAESRKYLIGALQAFSNVY